MSKFKSETSIGYMSLEKGKIKILKKMLIGHLKTVLKIFLDWVNIFLCTVVSQGNLMVRERMN